jgi:hypothetical protein
MKFENAAKDKNCEYPTKQAATSHIILLRNDASLHSIPFHSIPYSTHHTMSSEKRPAPYDSSDDEADLLETFRVRKTLKREVCDNDATLALELQKQEDSNYNIPYPTNRQGQEKKHVDGEATKIISGDTDSALQEWDPRATYAMCCLKCS